MDKNLWKFKKNAAKVLNIKLRLLVKIINIFEKIAETYFYTVLILLFNPLNVKLIYKNI